MRDRQSAPIDERTEDPSVYQMWKHGIHPLLIKIKELGLAHFSGSHHQLPMLALVTPIATLKGSSVRTMRAASVRISRLTTAGSVASPPIRRWEPGASARADFVSSTATDWQTSTTSLNIDVANSGQTSYLGHIGNTVGTNVIDITTTTKTDTGAGNAIITPSVN
jgi:hypothetical protein